MAICLVYSQSTGGIIGVLVAFFVAAVARSRFGTIYKFSIVSILGLVVIFSVDSFRRFWIFQMEKLSLVSGARDFSGSDVSLDVRVEKALIGLRIIADNPVLGIGPGRYSVLFHEYATSPPIPSYYFSSWTHKAIVENVYVQIGVEIGLLGMLLFCIFVLRHILRGRWSTGTLSISIFVAIGLATQSSWTFIPIWIAIGLLAVACGPKETESGGTPSAAVRGRAPTSVAGDSGA
ncbi:hypothetical protein BJH93_09645 [Kocuria polaris]|nr:hypothetical protein [Kocuria polaris]